MIPLAPAIIAKQLVWHSIKRTFSVICVLLVIGGLCWAVYVMAVKPHVNPTKTTLQKAETINNEYQVKKRHRIEIGWGILKIW